MLIDDFKKVIDEMGLDKSGFFIEKIDDYDIVSFGEMSSEGVPYNVMLIFHSNNDAVEIHIRKEINIDKMNEYLKMINDLNADYFCTWLFIKENFLVLKTPFFVDGDINSVLKAMQNSMDMANDIFPKF